MEGLRLSVLTSVSAGLWAAFVTTVEVAGVGAPAGEVAVAVTVLLMDPASRSGWPTV